MRKVPPKKKKLLRKKKKKSAEGDKDIEKGLEGGESETEFEYETDTEFEGGEAEIVSPSNSMIDQKSSRLSALKRKLKSISYNKWLKSLEEPNYDTLTTGLGSL